MSDIKYGTFSDYVNELCQDDDFKKGFERENERLDTAIALMKIREEEGLTQKQLAEKVGKPQSTIARIESGTMNVTFDLMIDIVQAMGRKLSINISKADN